MCIIVASGNIFRRELTSYLLDEAGYDVVEASDLAALLAGLADETPLAIVLDRQFNGGPGHALEIVRLRSRAPVLWLTEHAAHPFLSGEAPPADALAWPYHPAELLARVALLLEQAEPALPPTALRARYAGAAE